MNTIAETPSGVGPKPRTLRFNSPSEAIADARSLVAADAAGTLNRAGTWTLGQNLSHLAAFLNYPHDGYPKGAHPPWIMKVILKTFMQKRMMNKGFPRGVKIPGVKGGTFGAENISAQEALLRYEKAWARLQNSAPTFPNPLFGPLSHQEWITFNLRHCELHQSNLIPS